MNLTETPIHPLVRSMPDGVLYGRGSSALIWLERHRSGMQVMPTLADLARERQARGGRPAAEHWREIIDPTSERTP